MQETRRGPPETFFVLMAGGAPIPAGHRACRGPIGRRCGLSSLPKRTCDELAEALPHRRARLRVRLVPGGGGLDAPPDLLAPGLIKVLAVLLAEDG
jgi:hypothetical protein